MSRLTPLLHDRLEPEQRALLETIIGGKRGDGRDLEGFLDARGAMRGPFNALLHRPDLGHTLLRVGEQLRFEGRLPTLCREIAILVVAAHFRARYEWWAHARIAHGEGLPQSVIDAIAAGADPALDKDDERTVYAYTTEMMELGRVSERTHQSAAAVFGEAVLVELVVLLGYYATISLLLNAFQVVLPPGQSTPFDDDGE
ncbi:MAG: carboxymuconolactone decarboxylase family protein [Gammaproteobacteria bacterium]|nr:carboxymuconolactone decarboxylase family protein [Gammaproteobacteria bacterium]